VNYYNPPHLTLHVGQKGGELLISVEIEFLNKFLIRLLLNRLNEYLIHYPNQNLNAIILQNIRGVILDD